MEDIRKFEINNKLLEDFDTLMTYHLDKVEELVIKENLLDSKLYNIISLCVNVKTLIIEGDLRVDSNKIVYNLCRPELLENLILNSVKIPTNKIIKRFTNLHIISLSNIKFSNVKYFFNSIGNLDSVIALKLEEVDLQNESISICKEFKNLEFLNINGIVNCKFDDFSFLINNKNLKRIGIKNIDIPITEVKTILEGNFVKEISVTIFSKSKSLIKNTLIIDKNRFSNLIINVDLFKKLNVLELKNLDNLSLVLDEKIDIKNIIKKINKTKINLNIIIKNILIIDKNDIKELVEKLKINEITLIPNEYDNLKFVKYNIDEYLEILDKLKEYKEKIPIPKENSNLEIFELVFANLLKDLRLATLDENYEFKKSILNLVSTYNNVAVLVKIIFEMFNINVNIIQGTSLKELKTVYWNQIELDGSWYNLDYALELYFKNEKSINSKKFDYKKYLLSDEDFYTNHVSDFGILNKCNKSFYVKIEKEKSKNILSNLIKKIKKEN